MLWDLAPLRLRAHFRGRSICNLRDSQPRFHNDTRTNCQSVGARVSKAKRELLILVGVATGVVILLGGVSAHDRQAARDTKVQFGSH